MTKLEKVEMVRGSPFLIAPELENSPTVNLIGGIREIKTKFSDKQKVIDVEIKKSLTEDEYKRMNLTDIKDRLESNTRSWFINGTSFNYLIDTLGDDDDAWNGKQIAIESLMQVVQGDRKEVIYAKGSI